jgi:hypothetical protein
LTRSVPDLQFDDFATLTECFDFEINADRRDMRRLEGIIRETKKDGTFPDGGFTKD